MPVLSRDGSVVAQDSVRLLERVAELVALEDVVVGTRLVARAVLRVHGPPDGPQGSGTAFDPDHDPLGGPDVVDAVKNALGEDRGGLIAPHRDQSIAPTCLYDRGAMVDLASLFRNPFSFLFARSSSEERVAAYVIREHERGRSLTEILNDPYVRNRLSPSEQARLLDRPEVIRAIGGDVVAETRAQISP